MTILTSKIAKALLPTFVRRPLLAAVQRAAVLRYYAGLPAPQPDEVRLVLDFLRDRPIRLFPYPSLDRYVAANVEVFDDPANGMRYVLLDGKKLYYRRGWGRRRIRNSLNGLLMEQDPGCPHCYVNNEFRITAGDVLVDVGAAEGNFALINVESCSRLILFESNPRWIEALQATFAPWKDKVTIVNKFVGDTSDDTCATLDEIFGPDDRVSFLKIDVEGAEARVLNGARRILRARQPLKVAICTYHKQQDEHELTRVLQDNGFRTTSGNGFMLLFHDKSFQPPYLRRGIVRGEK